MTVLVAVAVLVLVLVLVLVNVMVVVLSVAQVPPQQAHPHPCHHERGDQLQPARQRRDVRRAVRCQPPADRESRHREGVHHGDDPAEPHRVARPAPAAHQIPGVQRFPVPRGAGVERTHGRCHEQRHRQSRPVVQQGRQIGGPRPRRRPGTGSACHRRERQRPRRLLRGVEPAGARVRHRQRPVRRIDIRQRRDGQVDAVHRPRADEAERQSGRSVDAAGTAVLAHGDVGAQVARCVAVGLLLQDGDVVSLSRPGHVEGGAGRLDLHDGWGSEGVRLRRPRAAEEQREGGGQQERHPGAQ
ncbi:hypothetical protein [Streptomyces exfoliatus]|uniref:hypothetical protein n=1 Tax=Streptomyces exfoliatus TaxID=1905 RepID=UPI001F526D96|nr:hypothetical protein [Streptomyces exfoliatus]